MTDATTLDALKTALEALIDPTFEKSLGELKTLSEVCISDDRASCKIALSTPSDVLRSKVRDAAEAVAKSMGIEFLEIDWQVRVPTRQTNSEDPIPQVKNVILIMSGKGGVGKSTVATNLALALRRAGTRVGVLDADIYGPSIPTMFGIDGRPHSKDGKRIEPMQRFGLELMSIGFLLEDAKQAVIFRGPMLHGALNQFIGDVNWSALDYLIVDLPPGTGDIALTLAQKLRITGAVIVTTPQDVALQDVYKGVSMCNKTNIPILGVIENMSYFVDPAGQRHELFGSGGGQKIADFAKAPLFGKIPLEPAVREWGDKGTPVVQADPASEAGKLFTDIANQLTECIARSYYTEGAAPKSSGPKRLRILR